jgi:hypothetical protein
MIAIRNYSFYTHNNETVFFYFCISKWILRFLERKTANKNYVIMFRLIDIFTRNERLSSLLYNHN